MTTKNFLKSFFLPPTLHENLSLAMLNLDHAKNHTDNYKINHNVWHNYNKYDNVCEVCFAGAFLALSLHFPFRRDYHFENPPDNFLPFRKPLYAFLNSLDSFRILDFYKAILYFYNLESDIIYLKAISDEDHLTALKEIDTYIKSDSVNYYAKIWDPEFIQDSPKQVKDIIEILKKHNI